MAETLSKRGEILLGAVRRNFELLREHEKVSPGEVNQIVAAMIEHIRSWKPLAITAHPEHTDGR